MFQPLQQIFNPPILEPEEQQRITRLFHTFLFCAETTIVLAVIVLVIYSPTEFVAPLFTAMVGVSILGLHILLKRGHLRMVSWSLPSLLFVAITTSLFLLATIRTTSITSYYFIIILVALALGEQAVFIFGCLTMLAIGGLFFAETNHLIAPLISQAPTTTIIDLMVAWSALTIFTLLLRTAVQQITAESKRARERTAELNALNADLERRVAERTSELQQLNLQLQSEVEERRRVDIALQQSHEKLQFALKAARIGTWDWDMHTDAVSWSDAIEPMFGMPAGSFGRTFEAYNHALYPADRAKVQQEIQRALAGAGDYDIEHRVNWPDGSVHWIAGKGDVRRDETGQIIGMSGIAMDITARKITELENQRYADIIKHMSLALSVWQLADLADLRSFRLLTTNPAALQLWNTTADQVLGRTLAENFPLVFNSPIPQHYAEVIRSGQPQDLGEVLYGDARVPHGTFSVKAFPLPDNAVGVLFDNITERKQAERKQQENYELLQTLIQASPLAIYVLDAEARVQIWNPAAERILGWSASEMIGQVLPAMTEAMRIGRARLLHGEVLSASEGQRPRKDGTSIDVSVAAAPLYDAKGQITRHVSFITDITERKKAERALRESEARLQAILEYSPAVIFLKTLDDGRYQVVNRSAEELLGLPAAQIIGKSDAELFPPQLAEQFRANDLVMRESGQIQVAEQPIIALDGQLRTYLRVNFPLRNAEGHVYAMGGIATDITERKKAEHALRESEARLQAILEYSPAVIFLKTLDDGRYQMISRSVEQMLGMPAAQIIGKSDAELFPAPLAQHFRANDLLIQSSGEIQINEQPLIDPSGRHRTYLGVNFPLRNAEGRLYAMGGVATDITDRKRAEEAVLERIRIEAFNADIGRALTQGNSLVIMLKLCSDAMVNHLNAAFARIWTLNEDDQMLELQASSGIYTHTNGAHSRIPVGQFKIGLIASERQQYFSNDMLNDPRLSDPEWAKREGMVAFAGSPLLVNERIVGVMAVFARQALSASVALALELASDTIALGIERWRAEMALRESEAQVRQLNAILEQRVQERTAQLERAVKELEAFSYSVSHDLRAPLRAIDGFSRILLEDYSAPLPAEAKRYLQRVRYGTQRMGNLIDDLLAFSRLGRQALKLQKVKTKELVQQVLDELREERAQRAVEIVLGELPNCEADPAMLRQVFVNLLSNALKFTRNCATARIEIGSEWRNGGSVYFVRDNGAGFDMQYANKLFGVFQRLHRAEEYEGTGVGLAIVHRIIQRHHGRIWAHSVINQGTIFYFTIGEESYDASNH